RAREPPQQALRARFESVSRRPPPSEPRKDGSCSGTDLYIAAALEHGQLKHIWTQWSIPLSEVEVPLRQCLQQIVQVARGEFLDQPRQSRDERQLDAGLGRQFECDLEVLVGPAQSVLAPFGERSVRAAADRHRL